MSIKAIQKARKAVPRDNFENGTVIKWLASGQYRYAAIKTPVGWFTTAQDHNVFVPRKTDWAGLLGILARSETSDVEIATQWQSIDGSS